MKPARFVDEFRNPQYVNRLLKDIRRSVSKPWVIMEICGGQTHAIIQSGIDRLLPEEIELVHGPGCPVCVTSLELVDKAIAIASRPEVIFCSYGDMLRVPGSETDLSSVRASGGKVEVVYSPIDAVKIAQRNPEKQVVFFAIGFETTAPVNATSVVYAQSLGLNNYSVLISHVTVPPAMKAILGAPRNRVQGFLAAGHVCAVMGFHEYHSISQEHQVPIVVTGFEPFDILKGILMTVNQRESGKYKVENAYSRAVTEKGNVPAQEMIARVFQVCDRNWRGIGTIPSSGWMLRPELAEFDAEKRFQVEHIKTRESEVCISGEILQGLKKPMQCPEFGKTCTPSTPLGATMVSSEGACAAYYQYARKR